MVDKVWVDDFEILENNGQIGINMILEDEPVENAMLVYDGRNCAILIRNMKKAYIFTNIVPEARAKLLNAGEVMMIESNDTDVLNSYMCEVKKVPEIPVDDTIPAALAEMLQNIKGAFGEEGCAALARRFWNVK